MTDSADFADLQRDACGSGATMSLRLLVFAPTRRAPTQTFVRANLERLPFALVAYFGDERPASEPWRWAYGSAILLSKRFARLHLLRLAGLPAALVARGLIRRHRPDLVLVEFGFHAVRVMEASAWSGVPLVVNFHGADASVCSWLGLLQARYRRLMRLAAGVTVKSEPMRRTLLDLGARSDHLLVSPAGADERLFHGADPAAAPPRFLAVGRFVAKKGPLLTLRAFARLLEGLPTGLRQRCSLVMVGEGPLLEDACKLVQELGLATAVTLAGRRKHQEVARLMREARAFVQHSLVAPDGDSEGSPVAVMEAQLSGLPVVATRHGGIPEVVLEEQTGLLVEEGDVEGMAVAMARLAREPDLALRMGKAGHDRAINQFTTGHHVKLVSNFLAEIASRQMRR